MENKVKFYDKKLIDEFLVRISTISTILSLVLIFISIPEQIKIAFGGIFILVLIFIYQRSWREANALKDITVKIDESDVNIKVGDLFKEPDYKVISFNEYFDTVVDEVLVNERSINGIFLKEHIRISIDELDNKIKNYPFEQNEIIGSNQNRPYGKKTKYKIGTIFVFEDYILTAFSKFDEHNRAYLTMPEYLEFLINFWDKVNKVYAQKSVSVPIFGSGITRIKEHKNISDEELLKIMIWTFKISEMRFKYPAKLSIIIHNAKINQINLLEIKNTANSL
ncbi:macro domain-containing protein [Alkanindiges illinoisensis]|uniref:macro domain-containing protein n=1 Tax=Alkanindiges illinoisensis TaxID=197183 RepID=UPI00047D7D22|nr:macro domain-containing protein [Alkanindiges illinoisensis]